MSTVLVALASTIARAALRTLQFTLAITIAGLYGVDLAHSTSASHHADASWIYAEVVATLSALTCIIHCFVTVKRVLWCFWEFVLLVLWAAQIGVFGSMFLGPSAREPENLALTGNVGRMKAGVGLGVVCMVLWFTTFVLAASLCCTAGGTTRGTEKVETGRDQEMERVSRESDEVDVEVRALQGEWKGESSFGEQKKESKI